MTRLLTGIARATGQPAQRREEPTDSACVLWPPGTQSSRCASRQPPDPRHLCSLRSGPDSSVARCQRV